MRIGVLGGTFNPPHIGHTNAAAAARDALGLDLLLFMPANLPPHKQLPAGSATNEQRLRMTELAAESIGACVSRLEFERGGKSYTADTLEQLRAEYPGAQLWLIIGTDMLLTLQNWYAPERIFSTAGIAVVAREPEQDEKIAAHKKFLEEKYGAHVDIVDAQVTEISSTELRSGGVPRDEFLPEKVLEYIRENRLYEQGGDA